MIKLGNIKKEHLVGAAIGVGTVAVGYYLYKKNQNNPRRQKMGKNKKRIKIKLTVF